MAGRHGLKPPYGRSFNGESELFLHNTYFIKITRAVKGSSFARRRAFFSVAVEDVVFRLTGFHLVVDPGIGFFEAGAQGDGGFPAEPLFDKGIVTATATDAFWSVEFVAAVYDRWGWLNFRGFSENCGIARPTGKLCSPLRSESPN